MTILRLFTKKVEHSWQNRIAQRFTTTSGNTHKHILPDTNEATSLCWRACSRAASTRLNHLLITFTMFPTHLHRVIIDLLVHLHSRQHSKVVHKNLSNLTRCSLSLVPRPHPYCYARKRSGNYLSFSWRRGPRSW